MRILISPDKFKGTLTAPAAALAMAEGARLAHPSSVISLCPIADGGEGTLATLLDATGGSKRFMSGTDPWGRPARLPVALLDDGTFCIESSSTAVGDPLRADSSGLGSVLAEIAATDPEARVVVGIGGTVSTDGGVGLARALGWRFLDGNDEPIRPGGGGLIDLHRIVPPDTARSLEITGLCDVDAPLTGEDGSARRFASQKGAGPDEVAQLERGLQKLAEVVGADLGVDLHSLPHAGAGGGIAAGIAAFCGGRLASGFDYVAAALRLRSKIESYDLVVTGEGRFDEQSIQGKASAGIARLSHEQGVPCLGLFGQMTVSMPAALGAGFSDVATLGVPATDVKRSEAASRLTEAAAALLSRQPV